MRAHSLCTSSLFICIFLCIVSWGFTSHSTLSSFITIAILRCCVFCTRAWMGIVWRLLACDVLDLLLCVLQRCSLRGVGNSIGDSTSSALRRCTICGIEPPLIGKVSQSCRSTKTKSTTEQTIDEARRAQEDGWSEESTNDATNDVVIISTRR